MILNFVLLSLSIHCACLQRTTLAEPSAEALDSKFLSPYQDKILQIRIWLHMYIV